MQKKIEWKTLDDCAVLSAYNALRFVKDAKILIGGKDTEYTTALSAMSLLALAFQEIGKICLALEHYGQKRDIDLDEYHRVFRNHKARIKAAKDYCQQVDFPWGRGWPDWWEEDMQDMESVRLASLYTDYDFELGRWINPLLIGPDGTVSPVPAMTSLFDKEERDGVASRLRFKEWQVLIWNCHNMIAMITNTLGHISEQNKTILKDFPQLNSEDRL